MMLSTLARRLGLALAALGMLASAGCGAFGRSASDDPFGSAYPTVRDQATGLTAILGTPDLAVGTFRVAIALSDRSGLVRFPSLVFESRRPGSAPSETPAERVEATFAAFPDDIRGLHTTSMTFDRAGKWTISASVPRPDGSTARITLPVTIAARASAPVIGSPAPKSKNRTARDVPSLDRLTTGTEPDAALYQQRIADSIAARRPLVVIFTSPAFCTTPLCGPQVEEASDLVKQYGDRVDFVHVDLFENPHEIQGDLSRAKRSSLLKDWGLRTDQWTFVIGADGRVAARFEAFAPRAELEPAITRVLG